MKPEEYEQFLATCRDTLNGMLAATRPSEEDYGTSLHWPHCSWRGCIGCVPDAPVVEWEWDAAPKRRPFDLSIFRRDA